MSMINYVQSGNVLTAATPAGGWESSQIVVLGDAQIVGVATITTVENEPNEISLEGVHMLPKAAGAIGAFASVYVDPDALTVSTDDTGIYCGYSTVASSETEDYATVKLQHRPAAPVAE